ncbi:NAD-dependent epimerase/dehydratase family protein [Chloroflexota bacterium]
MRVLVTGGAGFIGRSMVDDLLAHGFEVRVLDKTKGNLTELVNPALEIIEGGIEDQETVQQVMTDVDIICHLAETFSSHLGEVLDIDVKGNVNLLEAATKCDIKHFLFASTHRVYGKPRYLPVDEEHPLHPEESGRALYAIFKLANEKLCLSYWWEHGLPVTIFRFWWAFSHEIGGRALRTAIDTALEGQPITVPEKAGGNFLHNDDAANAFRLAMLNEKAYGEIFNLSSGTFTTWQELAEFACELTKSSSQIKLIPKEAWKGNTTIGTDKSIPYECNLDISKAERLTGYKPKYSPSEVKSLLREAINRLVLTRKKE